MNMDNKIPLTQAQQAELSQLATIGCTDEELAASMECDTDTMIAQYGDLIKKSRLKTKAMLKKIQWKLAQEGNSDALHIVQEQTGIKDETWKTLLKKLKRKQQEFVCEYLKDFNATQAAIRAGYSAKTAKEIGHENLTKPHIRHVIDSARKDIAEDAKVTREWILEKLRNNAAACLKPGPSYNPGAANKALEMLGKELKMFIDRRLIGVRKVDDMSEEEILESLGGEPGPEELIQAAAGKAPGNA